MNQLDEIIKKLDNTKEDWRKLTSEDLVNVEDENFRELFNDLITLLKKKYKETNGKIDAYIEENFKEISSLILDILKNTTRGYFCSEILRKMENENEVKSFFRFAFDEYILRYDPNFETKYESFNFDTEEKFLETLKTFDSLTRYYIKRHYTVSAIEEDLYYETELAVNVCKYFADLINQNYLTLQLNIMIDQNQSI